MCFSLPESNSFPGPRQLHINWPRRQRRGYSTQVLWRCHRQPTTDLEVSSHSLSLPLFHIIFLLALFPCTPSPLFACVIVCLLLFLSQSHTNITSLSLSLLVPSFIDPSISFLFYPSLSCPASQRSLSPPVPLRFLRVALSQSLFPFGANAGSSQRATANLDQGLKRYQQDLRRGTQIGSILSSSLCWLRGGLCAYFDEFVRHRTR